MGILDTIQNFFKPKEPKTIVINGVEPGGFIPVDSINDTVILLPCPFQIRLTKACVCMTCDFIAKNCPMELLCRTEGCEHGFIRGCTNYQNIEDINCEEKRKIFREGCSYNDHIFSFSSRTKGNTTI